MAYVVVGRENEKVMFDLQTGELTVAKVRTTAQHEQFFRQLKLSLSSWVTKPWSVFLVFLQIPDVSAPTMEAIVSGGIGFFYCLLIDTAQALPQTSWVNFNALQLCVLFFICICAPLFFTLISFNTRIGYLILLIIVHHIALLNILTDFSMSRKTIRVSANARSELPSREGCTLWFTIALRADRDRIKPDVIFPAEGNRT